MIFQSSPSIKLTGAFHESLLSASNIPVFGGSVPKLQQREDIGN